MTWRCDAVVAGGGVIGASVAYHLAARGAGDVVVCEQGRAPGQGATTRSGGILRLHHTARCDIRLAARSLPTFREWGAVVGGDCGYRRAGFAMLADPRYGDQMAKNVAAVNEAGGSSEVLAAADAAALHPGLSLAGDVLVAYEPDGGYGDPAATTMALLDRASDLGVQRAEGVVVTGLVTAGDRVSGVTTNIGRISAPLVVLAAGAWSGALAATAGVDLPVEARRIGLARVAAGLAPGGVPAAIDDVAGVYFRPSEDGDLYFGVPCEPGMELDRYPDPVDAAEVEAAREVVARRVPAAGQARTAGTRAGFDGYTPDGRPAIGPAGPDGLYVCTGFSGGGYKVAPAVGELAAAELVEGAREELLAPYRPQRFATGALVESENPYAHV